MKSFFYSIEQDGHKVQLRLELIRKDFIVGAQVFFSGATELEASIVCTSESPSFPEMHSLQDAELSEACMVALRSQGQLSRVILNRVPEGIVVVHLGEPSQPNKLFKPTGHASGFPPPRE